MLNISNLAPITVIITTYNDQEYLEQAITSVLEQKLLPRQIIIVDDGSIELTAQNITQKFTELVGSIDLLFLRKENSGASSARNIGINNSTEKYIAFLDVDDRMLQNNLADKYYLIKDLDESYFGVYGGSITSTGLSQTFLSIDGKIDPALIDKEFDGIPGGSPFFLFSRKALINVGLFDESLKCNEDYDLIIRFFIQNKKTKGNTLPGFYRNIRENSLSRSNDRMATYNNVKKFLEKAERLHYYETEYLNYRIMMNNLTAVKSMILRLEISGAFFLARKSFKLNKPITLKQMLIYLLSFSFIS